MKISTAKTEVLHLSRNPDQCVLQVNGATLKQVEKFKYLGVAFTSDGRQDEELDTQIGKASAVMRAFGLLGCHETRIVKKGKALNFQSSFCSPFSFMVMIHPWVVIKRVRSQVQASKMRFSQKNQRRYIV